MPNFDLHDVMAQMGMMYERSVKYTKKKVCAKQEKLRLSQTQTPQILAIKALEFEKALDNGAVNI